MHMGKYNQHSDVEISKLLALSDKDSKADTIKMLK